VNLSLMGRQIVSKARGPVLYRGQARVRGSPVPIMASVCLLKRATGMCVLWNREYPQNTQERSPLPPHPHPPVTTTSYQHDGIIPVLLPLAFRHLTVTLPGIALVRISAIWSKSSCLTAKVVFFLPVILTEPRCDFRFIVTAVMSL
jgi:hypothetical protein